MKIYPIASSSAGNAILVGDGTTFILLDAGIRYARLQTECPVPITDVDAVLITHEHGDHIKAVPELIKRGTECYASEGTWGAMLGDHPRWPAKSCYHMLEFQVGTFKIIPFNVRHDVSQPFGYLLKSMITGKKAVYIVDSSVVYFDFKGISYWLLEANYELESLLALELDERVKKRIIANHMSIGSMSKFLMDSDLSNTEEIHLLHLSNANSNENDFVNRIQAQTGIPVYAH